MIIFIAAVYCCAVSLLSNSSLSLLFITIAAPLTVRDINRDHLSATITRMNAGVEPPWMVSRRVVGGCSRFMSRIKVKQDLAC